MFIINLATTGDLKISFSSQEIVRPKDNSTTQILMNKIDAYTKRSKDITISSTTSLKDYNILYNPNLLPGVITLSLTNRAIK